MHFKPVCRPTGFNNLPQKGGLQAGDCSDKNDQKMTCHRLKTSSLPASAGRVLAGHSNQALLQALQQDVFGQIDANEYHLARFDLVITPHGP
jgi:hypothetical protein